MGKPTKNSGNSQESFSAITPARARATKQPVLFSPQIVDEICAQVCTGLSLHKICSVDEMPSMQAFFNWVRDDAATREKYQTALATRAHLFAEQVVDIAEEKMTYTVTEPDPKDPTKMVTKEVETTSPEHQARQKLRVDARKWATSKLLPKVYGEKIGIGGADDLGPIRTITRDMSPEEAYALMMTGQGKLATGSTDPAEGLM